MGSLFFFGSGFFAGVALTARRWEGVAFSLGLAMWCVVIALVVCVGCTRTIVEEHWQVLPEQPEYVAEAGVRA